MNDPYTKRIRGVSMALTPFQDKQLKEIRSQINKRIGVELSKAETVQFLVHYYRNHCINDNKA
jgi:hypothetical protein